MGSYDEAIDVLLSNGYRVAKRKLLNKMSGDYLMMGLEVEVLCKDEFEKIKSILPEEFDVMLYSSGVIRICLN